MGLVQGTTAQTRNPQESMRNPQSSGSYAAQSKILRREEVEGLLRRSNTPAPTGAENAESIWNGIACAAKIKSLGKRRGSGPAKASPK